MRANPGGVIDPEDVVGRDALIDEIWRVLGRQSLILQAERRMGKSCLIRRMSARCRSGFLPLYRDLEGVKSPLEFVETLFRDVERHLSRVGKVAGTARRLARALRGVQLGMLRFPAELAQDWKVLMEGTLQDLVAHQDDRLVLFWDELPYMLQNIRDEHGEAQACDVLDNLRALRQSLPEVRMVFTGSIGLHHVLSSLRGEARSQAPTNDMLVLEVPPLAHADALALASKLIEGEGVRTGEPRATARAVAEAVDGVPYYIHHVIDRIARDGREVGPVEVEATVTGCLTHPSDPWHMRHYRERLRPYYGSSEPLALGLLDALAPEQEGLEFSTLIHRLRAARPGFDEEQARRLLWALEQDHYLHRADGRYAFRFPLIRRWWCLSRSL